MCRLYGFLSNEPTKVDCSLVFAQNALLLQSRADAIGRHHADGWGIATYQEAKPRLIKNTTAAFDDQSFSAEAERIYTTAAIAHVRKATVGVPSVLNTHPFKWGNWVFAHNGTVTGFNEVEKRLAHETDPGLQSHRLGTTDSEQYFLWLLSSLMEAGLLSHEPNQTLPFNTEEVEPHLRRVVTRLETICLAAAPNKVPRLNFLLTNGTNLITCRWNNSLHRIRRNGLYNCEICGIPHIHHHETVNHKAVAFASEPITGEAWSEVPNKTFEVISLNTAAVS